ncbi:MAG: hypothetical protein FWB79_00685 [Treponema sp.]|nr:hypothetical protein [Treponema sp.]
MPATVAAVGLAFVLAGCPADAPDIGWTAVSNEDSTAIIFNFNAPVTEKQLEDSITVAIHGGEVVMGSPAGYGRLWSLPVSISTSGTAHVSINSSGISNRPSSFSVIATTVFVEEIYYSPQDLAIAVMFNAPVAGLSGEHVTVTSRSGAISNSGTPRRVTGSRWLVPVTVTRDGTVDVSIQKAGVRVSEAATEVPVRLIRPTVGFVAGLNAIRITFDEPVSDLAGAHVVPNLVTAAATFGTLRKGVANNEWILPITVTRAGTVQVAIERAGFAVTDQADGVTLPAITVSPVTFTVAAYPATGITTRFTISFTAPVSLTQGAISLGGVGTIPGLVPASLTGRSREWSVGLIQPLPSGVATSLNVTVNMDGVQTTGMPLTITTS